MSPESELCPRRSDCLRHLDVPQRAPGDPGTTPVDLWVCSDTKFAAWRRAPVET